MDTHTQTPSERVVPWTDQPKINTLESVCEIKTHTHTNTADWKPRRERLDSRYRWRRNDTHKFTREREMIAEGVRWQSGTMRMSDERGHTQKNRNTEHDRGTLCNVDEQTENDRELPCGAHLYSRTADRYDSNNNHQRYTQSEAQSANTCADERNVQQALVHTCWELSTCMGKNVHERCIVWSVY